MKRFQGEPSTGVPGWHKPKKVDREVPHVMFLEGVILEPGDQPIHGSQTLGELKRLFGVPTGGLRLPIANGAFEVGSTVFQGLPDSTEIVLFVSGQPVVEVQANIP